METQTDEYSEYLEEKYLPGRDIYLNKFFYPRIYNELGTGPVLDLGFGAGAFLKFLAKKNRAIHGIDSNQRFVDQAMKQGFKVAVDDITKLNTIETPIKNAVVDNVLEHLSEDQIDMFFETLAAKSDQTLRLIAIVPDAKGYDKDPTHRTFITGDQLRPICKKHGFAIKKYFCYPFNSRAIGKVFYLNMQVLVIEKNP